MLVFLTRLPFCIRLPLLSVDFIEIVLLLLEVETGWDILLDTPRGGLMLVLGNVNLEFLPAVTVLEERACSGLFFSSFTLSLLRGLCSNVVLEGTFLHACI